MDQRNERLVHNQLVRATCKPDAGESIDQLNRIEYFDKLILSSLAGCHIYRPVSQAYGYHLLLGSVADAYRCRYFLITPKLLTGLDYDPRMRILVINNGASVTTCPSANSMTDVSAASHAITVAGDWREYFSLA